MPSEAQRPACQDCQELGKLLDLTQGLVITCDKLADRLLELVELHKFLLGRHSKALLEKAIHQELDRAEAEQKRRAGNRPGGFRIKEGA
jgi:hypothetical protein